MLLKICSIGLVNGLVGDARRIISSLLKMKLIILQMRDYISSKNAPAPTVLKDIYFENNNTNLLTEIENNDFKLVWNPK